MNRRTLTGRMFARPVMRLDRLEDRETPASLSNFLTQQHTDVRITFAAGNPPVWNLQAVDDDAGVTHAIDDALLYVGQDGKNTRPTGSDFDFIGVNAGQDYYRLPQTQNANLIYLGISGAGIPSTALDRYNPSTESLGRVSGQARWAKLRLEGVKHVTPAGTTGNGVFSVWQSSDSGPTVFMSNFNDGVSNPNGVGLDATDGISANDSLWVTTGGHAHFNYGFSQTGRYEITFRTSGYLDDGNTTGLGTFVESSPIVVYFSVGSVGQVQVDPATYSVNESDGTAKVTVKRIGGSDGQITINYATTNGTATAGNDFTPTSGTLTFADGQTQATISIPIIDDSAEEGVESFSLSLSQPGPASIADYLTVFESKSLLGTSKTATITINANDTPGPNQPPTIGSILDQSMAEDGFLNVLFTIGDDSTPSNNLTITATSSSQAIVPNSKLVPAGSGSNRSLGITPATNAFGSTTITVTVTDGGGLQASQSFVLTVLPVADTPVVTGVVALEDTQTPAGPTITRNAADGAEVTHIKIVSIQNGTLYKADGFTVVPVGAFVTFAEANAMKFTPNAELNSSTTNFGYTLRAATGATDATLGGSTIIAPITVTAVNDIPNATIQGDLAIAQNAGLVTIPGFVSAFGPGGGSDEASQSINFNLFATNLGLFTVAPAVDASGTLTFTVANGQSGESTVSLDVVDNGGTANGGVNTRSFTFVIRVAVNSPPVANPDSATVVNTQSVNVDVLNNDTDLDNQVLTIAGFTQPANGTVTQVGSKLKYTPNANFLGNDTFTYTATDGTATSAPATVTVTVNQGNRPPVANDDAFSVMPGSQVFFSMIANDNDPDSNFSGIVIITPPAHGTLTELAFGRYAYTPSATFSGTDTLTYRLFDSEMLNDTATVTFTGRPTIESFPNVFSEGDIDLGFGYEQGVFEPHIHDEENEGEFEPNEGVYHLRPAGLLPRPQGSEFNFLGPVQPSIYRFTQTQTGELLYLGFGTEEIESGIFANDLVRVRIQSVEGPGHVSIWDNTDLGPNVFVSTFSDSIDPNNDVIDLKAGSHTHCNWAFTQRGLYAITVTVEGRLAADGTAVVSEPATFFFAVDPANQAPDLNQPSSVATAYDKSTPVTGVIVNDADATGLDYTVEMSAAKGTLSLGTVTGVTFVTGDGTNDAAITIRGPLTAVNSALATLSFTPTPGTIGAATISIIGTDAGVLVGENALSDSGSITINVAEPVRNRFTAGSGRGNGAWLYRADGSVEFFVQPFNAGWTGGVRVSSADVTGDGVEDLIAATGPGGPTLIKVFDGVSKLEVFQVQPFEESFTGGLFVSTGDMDGDGKSEFVVSPDEGGGPRVQVYNGGTFVKRADFFGIDDKAFRGGARTGLGDLNADGKADLIVAAGFGGGPRIAAYHGSQLTFNGGPKLFDDFFVFENSLRNGVYVAAGDLNGDGAADLIAGAGPGGGPRVYALNGSKLVSSNATTFDPLANFFAGNANDRKGVRVAVADVTGTSSAEIVTGSASKTVLSVYNNLGTELLQQIENIGLGDNGIFVG